MALQSSGPITLGDINVEFGFPRATPRRLSQLYRNGGIVGAGAPNVPTAGAIRLSHFYGATNIFYLTISSNQANVNLRDLALANGWGGQGPVVLTINSGIYVSSTATNTPALLVNGSFPGGVQIINNGLIVGMGGGGGTGGAQTYAGSAGAAGGPALRADVPVSVQNLGTIAGGGGGGGGGQGGRLSWQNCTSNTCNNQSQQIGGGGGGGGRTGASANSPGGLPGWSGAIYMGSSGGAGTVSGPGGGGGGYYTSRGTGGSGGSGGGWGAAGASGGNATPVSSTLSIAVGPYSGGAGGPAVVGNANITWVATGTRLGSIQ